MKLFNIMEDVKFKSNKPWEEIKDIEIKDIAYNSSKCEGGYIFVAIKGETVDGHKYCADAYKRGCRVFILNDDIEIIVLDSNQNTVRIGVNAPKNVTVYREELYREIKNANISSKEVTEKSVKELHELIKDRKNNFSSSTYDSLTNKISKN